MARMPVTPATTPPHGLRHGTASHLVDDAEGCYLALAARDARFDGSFFTGVTSTGIYCRPVCKVRTPQRGNCRFFRLAAQAEAAGFRPCLRCRPELAPQAQAWSTQDATGALLAQACRLLEQPDLVWDRDGTHGPTVASLAQRLGVSDRHLRRMFHEGLGISPLQYLQTQRLLTAKQLLTDTPMPMTDVAMLSGFGSVRRFNDALKKHYGLSPGHMRRALPSAPRQPGARVTLAYRPPYALQPLLKFLADRALPGVELVDPERFILTRTLRLDAPHRTHTGWLRVVFDHAQPKAHLEVSEGLCGVLPTVIHRVKHWLDLDADPAAIDRTLARSFPHTAGVRLPGSPDGFELALRAVLGQQVTVQVAQVLLARVARSLGDPIETPWPELSLLPPTPAQLLRADDDRLGTLGVIRQRQRALKAVAHAMVHGQLVLQPGADPQTTEKTLLSLPGLGPWTASYVLMRALHWPDAFPSGDAALQHALGTRQSPQALKATEQLACGWQPWRSYAAMCLWHGTPPVRTAEFANFHS